MIGPSRPSKRYRFLFTRVAALALLLGTCPQLALAAEILFPGRSWENADPVALGWSLTELAAAQRYARDLGSTTVMIVQELPTHTFLRVGESTDQADARCPSATNFLARDNPHLQRRGQPQTSLFQARARTHWHHRTLLGVRSECPVR